MNIDEDNFGLSKEEEETIDKITQLYAKASRGVFVAIPERMKLVLACNSLLRESISGKGLKISYELSQKHYPANACISIEADSLTINDPETFGFVCDACSNLEMNALVKNKIAMDFMFFNTSKRISD